MKRIISSMAAVAAIFVSGHAVARVCQPGDAASNCAPPTGYIFDLAGTPVPKTYTQYTTSFVATGAVTNLSFALRDDPAFLLLDDVVLTTNGGSNLLVNGGFESGPVGSNTPAGWTYLNQFGAGAAGVVSSSGAHTGNNEYFDGAIQAYDGITQAIMTVVGQTYNLSFYLSENGALTTFSQLSTNGNTTDTGGNGVDLLVYAGAIPTLVTVPEPESIALLGLGAVGLAAMRRRKTK